MEQEMRILSPAVSGRRSPLLHQYLRQYSSADYSAFSPRTPLTPSSASFDEDDEEEVDNRLYLAGLSLQRQDFLSRYELCLSHLHEAVREARTLRLENAQLRVANADLAQRLKELSSPRRRASTSASAALEKEMRRLRIGDPVASSPPAEASPTSVLQMAKVNALPKSISVRSTGYKKMISPEGEPKRSGRIRVSTPVAIGSQQRVFVGASSSSGSGGKKEKKKELVVELKKEEQQEEAAGLVGVELDVYNQGMFKTELCNKWQESGGNCPYGENCQFAHGISELRPVIRHPRYKTEVCRMVLAGDPCPYGHRCHFRHALSPHQSNLHHL